MRLLVPIVAAALAFVAAEARSTAAESPGAATFRVAADAHVTASARSRNFGRARTLRIGPGRSRAYLRFRVAGVRIPIAAASLRVYVVKGGGRASFHPVATKNWRERRITFGAAPRLGRVAATAAVPRGGRWATFDVTPLVRVAGSLTIGISATRPIAIASREAGRAPRLLVGTRGGTDDQAVLVAAGDIADCRSTGDEATARVVDAIPGTVALLGDIAYERGSTEDFRCYDASWGRFKSRTRPSPGNHEYLTQDALPYFAYFGAAAGERGKGYYSYDLGAWHVVALNSNCSRVGGCRRGSAQEVWLRTDLSSSRRRCTLAYWHHPLFSSGQHGAHPNVRPLFEALYDAGAEVVLAGHDHNYERFAPQTPSGQADPARGIRQFVVGTGGKNYTRLRAPQPNSEVRNDNTFGVLKLTLRADAYTWQFVPVAGRTFTDTGSDRCH